MTSFISKDRIDSQDHSAIKITQIGLSCEELYHMKDVLCFLRRACYANCTYDRSCLCRLVLRSNKIYRSKSPQAPGGYYSLHARAHVRARVYDLVAKVSLT